MFHCMNLNLMYGMSKNVRFYIAKQLIRADRNTKISSKDYDSLYDIKLSVISEIRGNLELQKWLDKNLDKAEEFWKIILEGNFITEDADWIKIYETIENCEELVSSSPDKVLQVLKEQLAPEVEEQDKKAELQGLIQEDTQLDFSLQDAEQLLQAYQQQAKKQEGEQK